MLVSEEKLVSILAEMKKEFLLLDNGRNVAHSFDYARRILRDIVYETLHGEDGNPTSELSLKRQWRCTRSTSEIRIYVRSKSMSSLQFMCSSFEFYAVFKPLVQEDLITFDTPENEVRFHCRKLPNQFAIKIRSARLPDDLSQNS